MADVWIPLFSLSDRACGPIDRRPVYRLTASCPAPGKGNTPGGAEVSEAGAHTQLIPTGRFRRLDR